MVACNLNIRTRTLREVKAWLRKIIVTLNLISSSEMPKIEEELKLLFKELMIMIQVADSHQLTFKELMMTCSHIVMMMTMRCRWKDWILLTKVLLSKWKDWRKLKRKKLKREKLKGFINWKWKNKEKDLRKKRKELGKKNWRDLD